MSELSLALLRCFLARLQQLRLRHRCVVVFVAFRWLVEHQRKDGGLCFDFVLAVEQVPLGLIFLEFLLLLPLFLLRLNCKLLELVAVHLHVCSDHTVGDGCHCCIPVLVLATVQQSFHDNRVSFSHVRFYKLLNHLRIEHQKCPFSGLVVHTLRCQNQLLEQIWPEVCKLLLCLASQQFDYFFNLTNEDDFFRWCCDWPELKQSDDQRNGQGVLLLEVILYAQL